MNKSKTNTSHNTNHMMIEAFINRNMLRIRCIMGAVGEAWPMQHTYAPLARPLQARGRACSGRANGACAMCSNYSRRHCRGSLYKI